MPRLAMTISDADRSDVIRRLTRDIQATIGPGCERVVQASAELAATYLDNAIDHASTVVNQVQQHLHDERIDTTWPACPRHPRHPLWLRLGAQGLSWYCERDDKEISRLGELGSGLRPSN
jgi:hypothetical protein